MSLLTGAMRSADVIVVRPLVVLEIEKEVIKPFLETNPIFLNNLSEILSIRHKGLAMALAKDDGKSGAGNNNLVDKLKDTIMKFFG